MKINKIIIALLIILICAQIGSAATAVFNGSTTPNWTSTSIDNTTITGLTANNVMVGEGGDKFDRPDSPSLGDSWNISTTGVSILNNRLSFNTINKLAVFETNYSSTNLTFQWSNLNMTNNTRLAVMFNKQTNQTASPCSACYLVYFIPTSYQIILYYYPGTIQIGLTAATKTFNSTDIISIDTSTVDTGLKLSKNGELYHTFSAGNTSYSNGYIGFYSVILTAGTTLDIDNFRIWNTTLGNLTAWHDFGAGRQGSQVMVNFTNTTGATFVDLYDSDDNSTFSMLASNVPNATWVSLNQKAQVQAVRVVLKGNTTLTPEILEITMEDESLAPITQSNLSNTTPMATTVWITWNTDIVTNNTVQYSTTADLSSSITVKFPTNHSIPLSYTNNTISPKVKIENLLPNTVYYYSAYSYNSSNNSNYVNSTILTFRTNNSVDIINLTNDIISITGIDNIIQEAVDSLPADGGILNISAQQYDINTTIRIMNTNKTIQGQGTNTKINLSSIRSLFFINNDDRVAAYFQNPIDSPLKDMGLIFKDLYIIKNEVTPSSSCPVDITYCPSGIVSQNGENITIDNVFFDSTITKYFYRNIEMIGNKNGTNIERINKITIVNSTFRQTGGDNVYLQMTNGSVLDNNSLLGSGSHGFTLNGYNTNATINNNNVSTSQNAGINIYSESNNNTIIDNTFCNVNYGVRIERGNSNLIKNNTLCGGIYRRNYGILFKANNPTDNNTIINNRIFDNKYGIGLENFATAAGTNYITSNTIYNNTFDGLYVPALPDSDFILNFTNNIIVNNTNFAYNNSGSIIINSVYNDIWGNGNNSGNGTSDISTNPLIVNYTTGTGSNTGIIDAHLQSIYNRWNGSAWVQDAVTSPAIGAGDPTSDNSLSPWGGVIEMGAYGNTAEASQGAPTYNISGYVNDTLGVVIDSVSVVNGSYSASTNATGYYQVTSVINGTWNFSFSKSGYVTNYKEITINGADVVNQNVTLTSSVSTSSINIPANSWGMFNNWTTYNTTFSKIAANESNDVTYTYYNTSSGEWETYYIGYTYNANNPIEQHTSVLGFFNAQTTIVADTVTPSNTDLLEGWNMLYVEGTSNRTLSAIETDIETSPCTVSAIYSFNLTTQDYVSTGTESVQPNQGFLAYIDSVCTWTRTSI